MDYEQWKVTTLGSYEITKIDEKGDTIPKTISEYDRSDMRKLEFNTKALTSLHCVLTMDEYNKISSCKSAKEIWDKLACMGVLLVNYLEGSSRKNVLRGCNSK